MNDLQKKIYEKYKVEDFNQLTQYFEMKTSTNLGDLEIDEAIVYYGPMTILRHLKDKDYNPMEESLILFTTFLQGFYKFELEEITDLIKAFGNFKIYYLFKNVLKENDFFKEYHSLYLTHIERYNNIGIILMEDGKSLLATVNSFLEELNPDVIRGLLKEVTDGVEGLNIFD